MREFCDTPLWDSNLTWYTENPKGNNENNLENAKKIIFPFRILKFQIMLIKHYPFFLLFIVLLFSLPAVSRKQF